MMTSQHRIPARSQRIAVRRRSIVGATVDRRSEVEVEDDGRTIRLAVAKPCVEPGDEQGFTLEAWPDARVLYQAVYAGDLHGFSGDEYPGGNDRGDTDDAGRLERSWRVGDNAPPGTRVVPDRDPRGDRAGRGRIHRGGERRLLVTVRPHAPSLAFSSRSGEDSFRADS